MTDKSAIYLDDLTKVYTRHQRTGLIRRTKVTKKAVTGIGFTIEAGEMVGYVGPNGAGKSTTIKMITGVLQPTSGTIEVLGLVPTADRTALTQRIGVVFGQRSQLWWDLPLADSYELLHHVYHTDRSRHRQVLADLSDRLALDELLAVPVRQLSLGQRMRAELAAAFLHEPEIVVLDEPTIGLDVVAKYAVREFLADINQARGTTVILTTHDLDDIEQVCERLILIDDGQLVLDGSLAEFKNEHGHYRTLVVDLATAQPALTIDGAEVTKVDGPRQWVRFDQRTQSAADVITAVSTNHRIKDLSIAEADIEVMIRSIYENSPSAEG